MEIGIVITVFNCVEYTKACINSIRTTHPFHLILIDDYSTDDTKKFFNALERSHKDGTLQSDQPIKDIVIITDPDTDSLAEKWNMGMQVCKDRNLVAGLVCNNDILFSQYTIDAIVKRLQKVLDLKENIAMVTASNIRGQIEPKDIFTLPNPGEGSEADGPDFSCFLLRTDVWTEWGGFDTNYQPCLSYFSKIVMADGSLKNLGTLVYEKSKEKVLSYDKYTKTFVPKTINNWIRNKYSGEWFKPVYKHTKNTKWGPSGATFTPDHPIYTDTGWKKICNLSADDKVLTTEPLLSYSQKQLVLGSCLGDGSLVVINKLGDALFQVGHGARQKEYLKYKKNMLSSLVQYEYLYNRRKAVIQNRRVNCQDFSILRTKTLQQFRDWYDILYKNKSKKLTKEYLDLLTEEGLTYWYLDDGSIHKSRIKTFSPYVTIVVGKQHTKEELLAVKTWFLEKFHISIKIDEREHKWIIRLSTKESKRFFDLIAPYVPISMGYKLPDSLFPTQDPELDLKSPGYYYDTVVKVVQVTTNKEHINRSYCLGIEDTNNFVTLSGIAHNCYFEDNDTHLALAKLGYRCISITSAPYYHYGSITQNSVSGGVCKGYSFERNRAYFLKKWGVDSTSQEYVDIINSAKR